MRVRSGFRGKTGIISIAAAEVNQSIFFAAAIIIAGFVPLFTLSGIEGHIFGPMAKTYAYAIAGGLIATFTIAPALSLLLFDGKIEESETPLVRWLRRVYEPALEFVLANRIITFAALGADRVAGVLRRALVWDWNSCPSWKRATSGFGPPSRSRYLSRTATPMSIGCAGSWPTIRKCETVVSQHGRPDDGTDADGILQRRILRAAEALRYLARRHRQGEAHPER